MGIEIERLVDLLPERILENFSCAICRNILDPGDSLVTPCNHIFCRNCISRALRFSETCPMCREYFTFKAAENLKKAEPNFYRIMGRMSVKCEEHENGCKWQGEISDLPWHLTMQCPKKEKMCKKCKVRFPMNKHLEHSRECCLRVRNHCTVEMLEDPEALMCLFEHDGEVLPLSV